MRVNLMGALLLCLVQPLAQAQEFDGQPMRATGRWSGDSVQAEQLQLRETPETSDKGQIAGTVTAVNRDARRFNIGTAVIEWTASTQFKDVTAELLSEGHSVKVSGRHQGGAILAASIQAGTPMPTDTVQVTGVARDEEVLTEGTRRIRILGVPVVVRQPGYNRIGSLTQRQDSRRPEKPLGFDLAGRRATFSGEYGLSLRDRDNLRLDGRSRVRDLDHELKLELLYPVLSNTWLFVSGKAVYEDEIYRAGGNGASDRYLARDQTWLLFERVFSPHLSAQVGRININEAREWWWDDDLDAVRMMHDLGPWHTELAWARELTRERSSESNIDPEQRGITRVLGRASWLWAGKQSLDFFILHARDSSGTHPEDSTLPEAEEDSSDARLTWAGVRAIGDRDIGPLGEVRYWLDAAWLRGRETLHDYDEDDGVLTVDDVSHTKVRGHAFDLGLSLQTRLPARPSFTLAQAWSSGDNNTNDDIDRAFRQTGLHNNKWRFHGVNRFRYYGELLRPELSNLSIGTAGLGFTLGRARSLDVIYHSYRLSEPARSLRDARVTASLTGKSTDLGSEWDVVLGSREWARVDLALSGSMFRAGEAYGAKRGERAYQFLLEIAVNF